MARKSRGTSKKTKGKATGKKRGILRRLSGLFPWRWIGRWLSRGAIAVGAFMLLWMMAYWVINPPTTHTILSERLRLGAVKRDWVDIEDINPVFLRSVVAAEDSNFCLHWGFDMAAIRDALDDGAARGASTLTQQTVKNAFLWQGRSWVRKALEALMTPVAELLWSKRRTLEIYVNIAELDEGVFGVGAASKHYFGVSPADLSDTQAARLAAILPNPKQRSASNPSNAVRRKAVRVLDGARTIKKDGRSACFED